MIILRAESEAGIGFRLPDLTLIPPPPNTFRQPDIRFHPIIFIHYLISLDTTCYPSYIYLIYLIKPVPLHTLPDFT